MRTTADLGILPDVARGYDKSWIFMHLARFLRLATNGGVPYGPGVREVRRVSVDKAAAGLRAARKLYIKTPAV